MDTKHAKFVLQSWRPNGADASDPIFTGALDELERDSELAEWFTHEQALDAAIVRKLREFPVPEELPERILASHAVVAVSTSRRRWPLAIAAALALFATLAAFWFFGRISKNDLAAYRERMTANLSSLQLDFASLKLTQVQEWLITHHHVSGFAVPEQLRQRATIGCKTWTWQGQPVALICFSLGDGRAAHLFVVPRSAFSDVPASGQMLLAQQGGWATGSWTDGEFLYLVARRGDEASLKEILGLKV
jgi:hypothetical protein